jgi:hypothetical protein
MISDIVDDFQNLWKLSKDVNNYNEICDGFEGIITKAIYNRYLKRYYFNLFYIILFELIIFNIYN